MPCDRGLRVVSPHVLLVVTHTVNYSPGNRLDWTLTDVRLLSWFVNGYPKKNRMSISESDRDVI